LDDPFHRLTLCITPFRKLLKLPDLIRFRRMLGLFAFFYVCLHFLTYLGPESVLRSLRDVEKTSPSALHHCGFAAFVSLIPFGDYFHGRLDSPHRRKALANAPSPDLFCGCLRWVHYYWLVKSDVRKPLFYGALVGILLLWRLGDWFFQTEEPGARARLLLQASQ